MAEWIEMMPFGGLGPSNHALDKFEIPHGQEKFWELFSLLKSLESLCCGVCSKSNHSVVNNVIQRMLQLGVTLHRTP